MGKILIADIFNQFMKNFETGGYCHTACWLKKKSETNRQYGVVIASVGSAFKQSGFEFPLC